MNWPEHPFISPRTARRIFGHGNIVKQSQSDGNSLWPSQHFKVQTPGGAIELTCKSEIEDEDENDENNYRLAKVTATFDPSKPYSRYHAARLAQQLRRAASQARYDLAEELSWSESRSTMPTFFAGTVIETKAPEGFIPQRYRLWGPFADHPPQHKLPEPK